MKLRILKQLPKIAGQTVLVRVDFNIAIKNGKILNNQKIKEAQKDPEFMKDIKN